MTRICHQPQGNQKSVVDPFPNVLNGQQNALFSNMIDCDD